MISLICTNCQSELTMDDAFAGGVCRCHHCGTIQTVPSSSVAAKPLYQRAASGPVVETPSGIEHLAGGLSDNLTSSNLAFPAPEKSAVAVAAPPAAQPAQRKSVSPLALAIVAALLLLVGIGVGISFWARNHSAGGGLISPTFAGVPINANSVIYLLDNGNSNDTLFDPLKAACYKSLETLGSDRKFQVRVWDNGLSNVVFPSDGMHNASAQEIAACKRALADTIASGNSHLSGPLKQALAEKPGAVVIATGKWELERDDLAALAAATDAGVHLYTFGLGTAPEQGALKLAANGTGGQYRHLSAGELSHASD